MSVLARGLVVAFFVVFGAGGAVAQQGGELAALAAWVAKGQQKARIEGRVARALALNSDGRPMQFTAVTTAYLDGSRTIHLVPTPQGEMLLFSQGKATQGMWMLADRSGTLVRALEWLPTARGPAPMEQARVTPIFADSKAFWKSQLGTPVR
jgi:hypothetical protein